MSHEHDDSPQAVRIEALETLLVNKGLIDSVRVDEFIKKFAEQTGPMNGARMVAKAWVDPLFKSRLLANGKSAMDELGLSGAEAQQLDVVENTPAVHNVIVCTLCSCYPWAVLGLPPAWYKQPAYRSRIVKAPRQVLTEFGGDLDPETEIRVWDSSAEVRYMVLPQRPLGTEKMNEQALATLVSRDAMIGVAKVSGSRGEADNDQD